MATKPETNAQFLARLADSPNPLVGAFMVEALAAYAKAQPESTKHWPAHSFVSPEAWCAVAAQVLAEIDKR